METILWVVFAGGMLCMVTGFTPVLLGATEQNLAKKLEEIASSNKRADNGLVIKFLEQEAAKMRRHALSDKRIAIYLFMAGGVLLIGWLIGELIIFF